MATFDGTDEPLFADDLDEYEDNDPPPLPPPVVFDRPSHSTQTRHESRDEFSLTTQQIDVNGQSDTVQISNTTEQQQKKTRRPVLTFKVDRLFAENGLPYLAREFPKLKFKGKGHEASDLKHLLKNYEHWANMVYPKYTFNDFIKRVETLGSKSRQFKTEFRKMRLKSAGLPLSDDDEVDQENNDTNNEVILTEQYPANDGPVVPAASNQDDATTAGMESPPNLSDITDNDPYDDIDDMLDDV